MGLSALCVWCLVRGGRLSSGSLLCPPEPSVWVFSQHVTWCSELFHFSFLFCSASKPQICPQSPKLN